MRRGVGQPGGQEKSGHLRRCVGERGAAKLSRMCDSVVLARQLYVAYARQFTM